ncbi:30S ribosomal protein S15 [Candidatus Woesearchaeota archaeon]|nr:30S ribosomal protein S15 [Candidatus Woesearchaeota archaeon]
MARMHSRARGKSGSKRPIKQVSTWAPYKESEVEKLVVKYAKTGKTKSEIGMILRDSYGIQSVHALTGKRVADIVAENNLTKKLPDDVMALIKRLIDIRAHMDKNKQDMTAIRGLTLTNSKIRRLTKYYKAKGIMAQDWQLDMNKLKIYLE